MRRVHVNQHQPCSVLREDVDAVQLRECEAERELGGGQRLCRLLRRSLALWCEEILRDTFRHTDDRPRLIWRIRCERRLRGRGFSDG